MRNGGRTSLGALLIVTAVAVGACGDDDGERARATVPAETTTTTAAAASTSTTATTSVPAPAFEPLLADPALSPEQQVEAAYLFYWDVVLDAFERGDGQFLPLVLTGEALDHRSGELSQMITDGRRLFGTVDHDYEITVHSADEANVVDAEMSNLSTIDAASGDVIEVDGGELAVWMYTLVREEGRWLVSYVVVYR